MSTPSNNVINITDFLANRLIDIKEIQLTNADVLGFLRVIRFLQDSLASNDLSIDAGSEGFIITSNKQQLNVDFPFILLNVPEDELTKVQGKTAVELFTEWFTACVEQAQIR